MSDPFCGSCGHSDHEDANQGDFCYRVTSRGLCGCTSWEPVYEDDDDYSDEPTEAEIVTDNGAPKK